MSDYTDPQFWPQLKHLASTIDTLDYFQILNQPPAATTPQVRDAYYGLARALHPDKFFHITDEGLKGAVSRIYKRITEAYMVLKDEKKRIQYIKDISGPDRLKKLRYTEESEAEQMQQQKLAAKVCKTPKGDQMYQMAMVDVQNGRFEQAYKSLQAASLFEMGNAELKKVIAEVDKKRKGL